MSRPVSVSLVMILVVVVAALGAFIFFVERHQPTTAERLERIDRVFTELDEDAVDVTVVDLEREADDPAAMVLGALVLGQIPLPLFAAVGVVACFAIFHGHAHGTELPAAANPLAYGIGFVISTGLLHLSGIVIGLLIPGAFLLFGAGAGLLTLVIRRWGAYPDGVAFAVLLMNMAAPTIDYYTRPRVFGHDDS